MYQPALPRGELGHRLARAALGLGEVAEPAVGDGLHQAHAAEQIPGGGAPPGSVRMACSARAMASSSAFTLSAVSA